MLLTAVGLEVDGGVKVILQGVGVSDLQRNLFSDKNIRLNMKQHQHGHTLFTRPNIPPFMWSRAISSLSYSRHNQLFNDPFLFDHHLQHLLI